MAAASTAGSISPRVTRRSVVEVRAPEIRAASSIEGSMSRNAPTISRNSVVLPLNP